MNRQEQRILVVGPAWVGDMVMSQSLIQILRQQHTEAAIDMLAPDWSLPLVARMPGLRNAIAMPLGHGQFGWSVRKQLGLRLREQGYDQALVIPRSFKSALVPFHARIPVRTGFRGESRYFLLNDVRRLDKQRLTTTQMRYLALGLGKDASLPSHLPAPRLNADEENGRALRRQWFADADAGTPLVAIMPGAEYGPAKQWPAPHFHKLAKALTAAGTRVMVLGSAKERPLGETIVAGLVPSAVNLCGHTTLVDAVDLLATTQVAVSNDSGLMHVAAAVHTPVVAIYGSSSPSFTPPLADNAQVIYQNLSCSPCFKRVCPLGHTRCLHEITPNRVESVIRTILRGVDQLDSA